MSYEDLLLEKKDRIAVITLNAPDKMNAFTAEMTHSFILAMDEVAKDNEVRVVIITGAGRAFSAGGDMKIMKARLEGTLKQPRYERLQPVGRYVNVFLRMDKPVIAAINGACVGGGLSMALNCDIRIASEKAKFGLAFILRALVPDGGATYFLPRLVGTSKALELMLTGELIDAAEAKSLGILSQVVPPDELMNAAEELAAKIAQQPPIAVELTKRLVYRSMAGDIAHHLDWETHAQQLCYQTEDHRKSALAFLEKQPQPEFKGE